MKGGVGSEIGAPIEGVLWCGGITFTTVLGGCRGFLRRSSEGVARCL